MTSNPRRNWKRIQPTSLRHALELCKDHARERLNRSVERIAEEMGIADHWTLYKWIQTGRIPASMIPPYETACGIDLVTRWFAVRSGRLLIDVPVGRQLTATDMADLHRDFAKALALLADFYEGKAEAEPTKAALSTHLEQVAWHRANVAQHAEPELDFTS